MQINAVLMQALDESSLPCHVSVDCELSPDLPPINADTEQIKYALFQLIQNASQAVADRGRITLATSARRKTVRVMVRDNGGGIPPENRARLFQPFFTTKSKALGLGLATTRRLVEQNGGKITFLNPTGCGATFCITLPMRKQPVDI